MDQPKLNAGMRRQHRDVDGGWAWVVFVVVFLSCFVLAGLLYTTGLYYVAMLDQFGQSHSYTAWLGSLMNCFFMLGGPAASRFITWAGCRAGMILGSLMMTTGYLIAASATNLQTVLVAYGIIVATGMCFIYTSQVATLSEHFIVHHAAITSFAMTGVGVGIFFTSHLLESIMINEGWQISFIVCAGFSLQVCVLGSLLFPLPPQLQDKSAVADVGTGKRCLSLDKRSSSTKYTIGLEVEEMIEERGLQDKKEFCEVTNCRKLDKDLAENKIILEDTQYEKEPTQMMSGETAKINISSYVDAMASEDTKIGVRNVSINATKRFTSSIDMKAVDLLICSPVTGVNCEVEQNMLNDNKENISITTHYITEKTEECGNNIPDNMTIIMNEMADTNIKQHELHYAERQRNFIEKCIENIYFDEIGKSELLLYNHRNSITEINPHHGKDCATCNTITCCNVPRDATKYSITTCNTTSISSSDVTSISSTCKNTHFFDTEQNDIFTKRKGDQNTSDHSRGNWLPKSISNIQMSYLNRSLSTYRNNRGFGNNALRHDHSGVRSNPQIFTTKSSHTNLPGIFTSHHDLGSYAMFSSEKVNRANKIKIRNPIRHGVFNKNVSRNLIFCNTYHTKVDLSEINNEEASNGSQLYQVRPDNGCVFKRSLLSLGVHETQELIHNPNTIGSLGSKCNIWEDKQSVRDSDMANYEEIIETPTYADTRPREDERPKEDCEECCENGAPRGCRPEWSLRSRKPECQYVRVTESVPLGICLTSRKFMTYLEDRTLLLESRLWLLCLSMCCIMMGTLTFFVIYKDYVASLGHEHIYSNALSILGFGDIMGRIATGCLCSIKNVRPTLLYAASMAGSTCVLLFHVLPIALSPSLLVALAGAFGFLYGMQNVLIAVVPGTVFGRDKLVQVFGYQLFWGGLGAMIGPPIAGLAVDLTGSYGSVMLLTAGCCLAAAVLMSLTIDRTDSTSDDELENTSCPQPQQSSLHSSPSTCH